MFTAKNYVKVNSIEEAFELNKSRNNVVMGGLMWLKQSKKNINTLIDLSNLNLDKIDENADFIEIGAMVSLRALEKNPILKANFGSYFENALKGIVGVQFRNGATIGGSVYGRYGFSDVITALMALDTHVVIFDGEEKAMPLAKYVSLKKDNSILTKILIKKSATICSYQSMRIISTDFPILSTAISFTYSETDTKLGSIRISIGARPNIATVVLFENSDTSELLTSYTQDVNNNSLESINAFVNANISSKIEELIFGSNLKASKEYRIMLAKALTAKCLFEIAEKGKDLWK